MKNKISVFIIIALIVALAAVLSACEPQENKVSESFFAMDTFMKLELYGTSENLDDVKSEIEGLDRRLSPVNPEGDIYKLNQDNAVDLDNETLGLIKRSVELCEFSEGNLDITVYPIVEKWGFINKNFRIPSQSELDSLLKNVDYRKITSDAGKAVIPDGFKIDLGAVAKGYAADKSREILKTSGVKSAVINLGGTVLAYGKKPDGSNWRVGITNPENTESYMGVLECADKTVVTSGNYERFFEQDGKRYCHIIDPKTGFPADNGVTSVTVISDDGTKNDALSTALFIMGADRASEFIKNKCEDVDCVILTADKKAYISEDIKDSFKLTDKEYEIKIIN